MGSKMDNQEKNVMIDASFNLILHAGNARSSAMEALYLSNTGDWQEAEKKYEEARSEFELAHNVQTNLLIENARGAQLIPDILMVHAQDHFISAMVCLELCKEMTKMYHKIYEILDSKK